MANKLDNSIAVYDPYSFVNCLSHIVVSRNIRKGFVASGIDPCKPNMFAGADLALSTM